MIITPNGVAVVSSLGVWLDRAPRQPLLDRVARVTFADLRADGTVPTELPPEIAAAFRSWGSGKTGSRAELAKACLAWARAAAKG